MPCVVIMSAGRVPLIVDVKSRVGCVHALLVQEVYAKIIRAVVVRDAISISRPHLACSGDNKRKYYLQAKRR